jgi:hypothetical protein
MPGKTHRIKNWDKWRNKLRINNIVESRYHRRIRRKGKRYLNYIMRKHKVKTCMMVPNYTSGRKGRKRCN